MLLWIRLVLARHRYAMALGIHALFVADVITVLGAVAAVLRGIRAAGAADQQTGPGAYRCTIASTDGGAGHCTDYGADHTALNRLVIAGLCRAGILVVGILAAITVIDLELFKRLAVARHDSDAWAGRDGRAGREHHGGQQSRY